MPALTNLDISGNKLTKLTSAIGLAESLQVLNLDHNRLVALPAAMHLMPALRMLRVNSNLLESIPSTLENVKTLRVLSVKNNRISELPDNVGGFMLEQLSLSGNLLSDLPSGMAMPRLGGCLKVLELQDNKMAVLPLCVAELATLETLAVDNNPLRSPPAWFGDRGIIAVGKYIYDRLDRLLLVDELLVKHNFEFDSTKLSPEVKGAIHGGIGYLLEDDIKTFETKLDSCVNGDFYSSPHNVSDVIGDLVDLRMSRSLEFWLRVVDTLLDVMLLLEERKWIPSSHFRADYHAPLGRLKRKKSGKFSNKRESVACFAVSAELFWQQVVPQVDEMLRRGYMLTDWPFTQPDVADALNNFQSPYGTVGLVDKEVEFTCSCVQKHSTCLKKALVIVRTVYSDDEAARRIDEEDRIRARLDAAMTRLNEWSSSRVGRSQLTKEARLLQERTKSEIRTMKVDLVGVKRAAAQAKSELRAIQSRFNAFSLGHDFLLHQFESEDEANRMLRLAKQDMKEKQAAVSSLTTRLRDARIRSKLATKALEMEVLRKTRAELQRRTIESVVEEVRTQALRERLRRPWDGEEGEDYRQWAEINRARLARELGDGVFDELDDGDYDSDLSDEEAAALHEEALSMEPDPMTCQGREGSRIAAGLGAAAGSATAIFRRKARQAGAGDSAGGSAFKSLRNIARLISRPSSWGSKRFRRGVAAIEEGGEDKDGEEDVAGHDSADAGSSFVAGFTRGADGDDDDDADDDDSDEDGSRPSSSHVSRSGAALSRALLKLSPLRGRPTAADSAKPKADEVAPELVQIAKVKQRGLTWDSWLESVARKRMEDKSKSDDGESIVSLDREYYVRDEEGNVKLGLDGLPEVKRPWSGRSLRQEDLDEAVRVKAEQESKRRKAAAEQAAYLAEMEKLETWYDSDEEEEKTLEELERELALVSTGLVPKRMLRRRPSSRKGSARSMSRASSRGSSRPRSASSGVSGEVEEDKVSDRLPSLRPRTGASVLSYDDGWERKLRRLQVELGERPPSTSSTMREKIEQEKARKKRRKKRREKRREKRQRRLSRRLLDSSSMPSL
eukprot:PLAT4349.1.p1 GENE.PLAT4349.1~~PLAT4349.1.p1  ORF type:complete len:1156 (+),score=391.19 PLAT4349.1:261-3470(+)